jgi:folate-binding protein YgfZ
MPTTDRDIVVVTGSDAGEYLQTQLTQDVLKLDVGESAWSFLLTPKSEIIALMLIVRSAETEYTLEIESGWGDAVRNTIDEFLGRMDVSFSQRTVLGESEDEQSRIARGWPRMGKEIDSSVTPAMTGIVSDTIAFEKGCYTGQEFVARVHYRDAAPPKRLVHLVFDDDGQLPEGASIVVDRSDVGTVTSVARSIALGYVKRGVDTPSSGTVADVAVKLLAIRPS